MVCRLATTTHYLKPILIIRQLDPHEHMPKKLKLEIVTKEKTCENVDCKISAIVFRALT